MLPEWKFSAFVHKVPLLLFSLPLVSPLPPTLSRGTRPRHRSSSFPFSVHNDSTAFSGVFIMDFRLFPLSRCPPRAKVKFFILCTEPSVRPHKAFLPSLNVPEVGGPVPTSFRFLEITGNSTLGWFRCNNPFSSDFSFPLGRPRRCLPISPWRPARASSFVSFFFRTRGRFLLHVLSFPILRFFLVSLSM